MTSYSSSMQSDLLHQISKFIDSDTLDDISKCEWIQSNFIEIPKVSKVIVIDRKSYKIIRGNVESACDEYIKNYEAPMIQNLKNEMIMFKCDTEIQNAVDGY